MMKRMRVLLALLAGVVLVGCGNKVTELPMTPGRMTAPEYDMTIEETVIPADSGIYPYLTEMKQDICFYGTVVTESGEGEMNFYNELFVMPLAEGAEPVMLEKTADFIDAAFLTETVEGELVYTALFREADGEDCYVIEYDKAGTQLHRTDVKDADLHRNGGREVMRYADGTYAILSIDTLYLVNRDGTIRKTIPCPGDDYRAGAIADNGLYLAYTKNVYSAFAVGLLDEESGHIAERNSLPENVFRLKATKDGEILAIANAGIYRLSTDSISVTKLVDLKAMYLFGEGFCTIETDGDDLSFLYDNYDKQGKLEMRTLKRK